jgi:hypothetical protein
MILPQINGYCMLLLPRYRQMNLRSELITEVKFHYWRSNNNSKWLRILVTWGCHLLIKSANASLIMAVYKEAETRCCLIHLICNIHTVVLIGSYNRQWFQLQASKCPRTISSWNLNPWMSIGVERTSNTTCFC